MDGKKEFSNLSEFIALVSKQTGYPDSHVREILKVSNELLEGDLYFTIKMYDDIVGGEL